MYLLMKIISVIQTFRRVVLRMLEKRTDGGWGKNILEKVCRIKEGGGEPFMQKSKSSHVISIKFTFKISRKLISCASRKNKMPNCITNVYIFFLVLTMPVAALEPLLLVINISLVPEALLLLDSLLQFRLYMCYYYNL